MKRIVNLALIFSMLAGMYIPVSAQEGVYQEFYVSKSGSDTNSGTKNSPFATIEAAQMAVRNINKNMTGDIIVNIESGTYYLDDNLDFQTEDSGYGGYNVIYRGIGDSKPVISGGERVYGFTKSEYEDIYVADYDSDDAVLQMSVNSKRRYVAKSATYLTGVQRPDAMNTDAWFEANPNDYPGNTYGYYNPDTEYSCDGFYMSKEDIGNYENAEDMLYKIDSYWMTTIIPFEKIEQDPYRDDVWQITMEPGMWNYYASQKFNGSISSGNPEKSIPYGEQPFMLMNAFELLDEPGEFYYNRKTKKLYYMPLEGEDMQTAEVVIPKLRKLVYFDGNDVNDKVKNISFENIQFSDTKFDWSGGMRGTQVPTNSFLEDKISAVEGRRIDNISFKDNVFCNIGGTALDFSTASTNCEAVGNVFYDIGETAIAIGNRANKSTNFAPTYPANANTFYTQSMNVPQEYKNGAVDLLLDYGTRIYPSHYLGGDGASTVDNSIRFLSVPGNDAYVQLGRTTTVHQTWLDTTHSLSVVRPDNNETLECGIWRDDVSAANGEKPSVMFEFVRPYALSEITVSFKSDLIKDGENADFEVLASNYRDFKEYDVVHTQNGAAPAEINTYTPDSSKKYRYVMIRKLTATNLALSKVWIGTYDRKPYVKGQKADGIEIKNNVLQRIGVDKLAVGLLAYDVSNTEIQHNYIENVSYSGISVGQSWNLKEQSCEYIDCSYNWVENCNHTGQDGAGIYVLGPQPGSSYHNNRILNNNIAVRGFYTDNGTRWNTIKGNVIDGVVNVLSPYVKGMSAPGNVINYTGGLGSTNGTIEASNGIAENWFEDNYSGSELYSTAGVDGQYVFEAPTRAAIGQAVDDTSLDTLTNAGLENAYEYLTDIVPESTTNFYSGFANLYKDALWEGSGTMGQKQDALMQELDSMIDLGSFGDEDGQYPTEYKAKAQDLYNKVKELDTRYTKRWTAKMKEGREFLLDAEKLLRGIDETAIAEEKTSSKILADDFVFNSSQKDLVKRGRVSTTYPASEYAYMSTVTNGDNAVSVEFAPLTNGQSTSSFTVILGASMAEGFEQHSAYPEFDRLELEFSGNTANLYKVTKGARASAASATVASTGIKWNEINELSYRLSEGGSFFSPTVTVVVSLNGAEILNQSISAGSFLSSTDYGRYMGFYSPERNIRVYDGARPNFSQTAPITNVVGAEEIFPGSVYRDDTLKIELKDAINPDTVASGITTTNSLPFSISDDKTAIEIDVSSLKSNQTYTITTNENLLTAEGDAVVAGTYTIVTGLITNAENVEGKVQKLVSLGKYVQRADGSAVGTGDAGTSTDISKLTDGNASNIGSFADAVSFPQGDSVTIDLGKLYEITMIGASCQSSSTWHMSSTNILVDTSAPTDSSSVDLSIADDDISNGYYIKDHNETGRYVTFDKFAGGAAYLFETFVVAYVGDDDGGAPNYNENAPITNVVGAENIFPGSAYVGDTLKIEFKNELKPETVANGVTASNSLDVTLSEDNKALCVDVASLASNQTYTIQIDGDLLNIDDKSVEPAVYTIKTGLISNAQKKDGKVQKLVSKGKTIKHSNGGYMGTGADGSSVNLQALTDGYADNANDFRKTVSFASGSYVTIDLGNMYDISMIGASCISGYPWHMSSTKISVDANAPTNSINTDMSITDADISDGYYIKNHSENGRYVTFNKFEGGAAYLFETFVVAYVDADGPDAYMITNIDSSGETYVATGIETKCDNLPQDITCFVASYDSNGRMLDIKRGGEMTIVQGCKYKGFIWDWATRTPIVPAIITEF